MGIANANTILPATSRGEQEMAKQSDHEPDQVSPLPYLKSLAAGFFKLAGAALTAVPAHAAVIDMEGIAPAGSFTNENNSNHVFNGFNLFVLYGHYVDSSNASVGTSWANDGSDYLIHDTETPLILTPAAGGGAFSIQSFDATFFQLIDNGNVQRSHVIDVVGVPSGGGDNIVTQFTIDDLISFQTFIFGPEWTNLTAVLFVNSSLGIIVGGRMGYDNIVVNEAAITPVPLPAALPLFAGGLGLIGWMARRRRGQPAHA